MDYRFYIARRYLASRKQVTLISIITGISVLGVALGVASLIVVLSVMNGFSDVVRGLMVGLDPHIRIVSAEGRSFEHADSLMSDVLRHPEIDHVASYVQGKALVLHEDMTDMNRVVIVRGVDEARIAEVSGVVDKTTIGEFSVNRTDGPPGMVIGLGLGQDLDIFPIMDTGDGVRPSDKNDSRVQLLSAPGIERMTNNIFATPLSVYEVRGIFEMEPTYDETHVFISLPEAQRLFRMRGEVSGVELRLDDIDDASRIKGELASYVDTDKFEIQTWYDLQKSFYDVMELEKWGAALILALIVIVAAFNIIGSLTMVVIEKRHDIGVLKAMGVSRRGIMQVFLCEGALIGIIGTGVGLAVGLGLSLAQKHFSLIRLASAESFILDAYPVTIEAFDVSLIVFVSMALCLMAAIYPAFRAAAIEPAVAVQMSE
ncbi:MAG: FtsX-like permease family protein [Rhodothermales bacterium]